MTSNNPDISNYYAVAAGNFSAGKMHEAAHICKKILRNNPDDFDALHLLGVIATRMGNPYGATEVIRKAILLSPGDAIAHMNLGIALYQLGKLEDAVAAYRKAIKLQQNLSSARALLDSTRKEIKQLDEEIKSIDRSGQGPSIKFSADEHNNLTPNLTTLNRAAILYKHYGYVVIEDIFTEEYIEELHDVFESKYSQYFSDSSFDDSLKVGDKRFMVTVKLEGPFNTPEFYAHPLIMPLMTRLLGREFILFSLGAVISLPGAKSQLVHRDHTPLFEEDTIDAMLPSFAVTIGIPLIEMNETNGTTRFYGTTHRNLGNLTDKDKKKGVNPIIRKGSCILFDYRVGHEGTPNNSSNVRPLMYNIYSRSWFRDCKNYSKQKPMTISDSEYSQIPEEHDHLFAWTRNT